MGENPKKNPILWVMLIAIAALGGVAAWVMTAPKPEATLEPWRFTSIRAGETEVDAKNDGIVYSGDRLLARGPIVERRFDYVLLQDEKKLENTAAKARDAEINGKPVRFSGVQLTRGTGRVRMVVIDVPVELEGLPDMLVAANKTPGTSEMKLASLEEKLKEMPGDESVKVFTSPWYRLIELPDYQPPPPANLPDPPSATAPDATTSSPAPPAK